MVVLLLQRKFKSSVSSHTSDSKGNQLGFKVLSPGENPVVDIVAIHGLGGHRERSWTAANGTFWLKEFLKDDFPNARVLTYGHGADTHSCTYLPTQNLLHFAEDFVETLIRARESNPKSWGHNTQEADNDPDKKRIKESVRAVLFFGTPHSGANGVDLACLIGKVLSVYMFTDASMLKDLNQNSVLLEDIQACYPHASGHIKSIFFYETLSTEMITGVAEVIVPRRSAIIQGDRSAMVTPLYADHREMVKFQDKNEENYKKVVHYLSDLVNKVPADVERSWKEEKHHKNAHNGEVHPPSPPILPKPRIPVSRDYVRRPDIENFLTQELLLSSSPAVQPRCVLHGLGGSGKTQVASFWIEANKAEFDNIIFIDASSREQIEADLERAIRSAGPEWSKATWNHAISYLSMSERWLLFFDNVARSNLRLDDYLPNSRNGAVLITTRNRDYRIYAPHSHLQVGAMTETEAVNILHNVANVYPSSRGASIAIVKELGMLALAVTQVGASIFQKDHLDKEAQLNGYLNHFRKRRAELMREEGMNYKGSTYAAFDSSFELLPENARGFMNICAFLYHSQIPQALFEKSIKNGFRCHTKVGGHPKRQNLMSSLKSIFGSNWDDSGFQELIKPILQRSLLDGFPNQDKQPFYNIHPLVQTYVQDCPATDQDHYVLLAGQLLLGGIQLVNRDHQWDQELLPHVKSLLIWVREIPWFSSPFQWYIRIKGS
ncbi:hypothetical protein CPB86DRAFT_830360 [Serendipita vermifera]|nr:hypothetical protein CPB86DRAFT_830360 [Serendipita vermifera]